MPLGFKFLADEAAKSRGVWENTTGQTLYLNSDKTQIVTADSPDVGFVLCGPGGRLSVEDAIRYGIMEDTAPVEKVENEVVDDTREDAKESETVVDETRTPADSVANSETEAKAQKPVSDKAVTGPSTK